MSEILRHLKVPTGDILVVQGEKYPMEVLSIGDYGKEKNLKADFLDLPNEINGVPHGDLMPLKEKWVITLSTQHGCSMGCTFCDVPKVGPGKNLSLNDLWNQVSSAVELHPEVTSCERLNVHYARMGEPTWNPNVLTHAVEMFNDTQDEIMDMYCFRVHPVVSTMMPANNKNLEHFLHSWCFIKNQIYKGNAGLQLSINSTGDVERNKMFNGSSLDLVEISEIMNKMPDPIGRKYTLNFALAGYAIAPSSLKRLFPPERFICKLTPMHDTKSCRENGINTEDGYSSFTPYKEVEESLKAVGYDVIVFVPSLEEDQGLITCGNAVLSGRVPECEYEEIL